MVLQRLWLTVMLSDFLSGRTMSQIFQYNIRAYAHVSTLYINSCFSSWGDGVFMLAQTSTIAGLSLHYNKGNGPCFIFLVLYSIILYITVSGFVAVDLLWTFQATSVPVMFTGKVNLIFVVW